MTPLHLDLEAEVAELFRAKMREFLAFCSEHWQLTDKDMAELHPARGAEYRDGYNAAITDGLEGAFATWAEENDL
jgi:hypothetical protein